MSAWVESCRSRRLEICFLQAAICALSWPMQRYLLSITRYGRKVTGRSNSRERKSPQSYPIGRELCDLSLRPRQQQSEQFRAAFAVDDAVDEVGAKPPLEGDHRLLLVGNVIAEAFEREQETGIGPIGVDQVAGRAGQGEPT